MPRPPLGNVSPGGRSALPARRPYRPVCRQPYRAKTYDASFEWYFNRNSIRVWTVPEEHQHLHPESARERAVQPDGLPRSLLPANFTGDEVFQVTTPVNTEGGS